TAAFNATSWPNAVVIDKNGTVAAHEFVWKKGIEKLEQALEQVASKESAVACAFATPDCKAFCTGGVCYAPPEGSKGKAKTRQENPRMASLPDGSIYVAYASNKSGDNNIVLEQYKNGRKKKSYQVTAAPSDEYDVDCAAASDGTVWLAWTSNADSIYDICAASFKDGKLSSPMRVTKSTHDAFHPRIAIDADGNPWVAYYKWLMVEGYSRDRNVYVRRYAGGAWSGELEVSPPEPSIEDHSDPDIAAAGNEMLVAWSYDYHPSLPGNTLDAASPTIFIQSLTPALERKSSMQLMGSTGKEARIKDLSPSIAISGAAAACAWDANKEIVVRRMENGVWNALDVQRSVRRTDSRRNIHLLLAKDGRHMAHRRQGVCERPLGRARAAGQRKGRRPLPGRCRRLRRRRMGRLVRTDRRRRAGAREEVVGGAGRIGSRRTGGRSARSDSTYNSAAS
ncbi:MAG: hypothetical protein HY770_07390, partial [Chitinivibrionia bacterium]|nr:hypothetical protein [Chitinivibrionia bacterium]